MYPKCRLGTLLTTSAHSSNKGYPMTSSNAYNETGCVSKVQQHPDYHTGFFDAIQGEPLHYGMTREYRSGWINAHRCKRILVKIESQSPAMRKVSE